jgi:hypothetical protein
LKENATLTDLHLCENEIGNSGAEAIARALKVNSTLMDLKLLASSI